MKNEVEPIDISLELMADMVEEHLKSTRVLPTATPPPPLIERPSKKEREAHAKEAREREYQNEILDEWRVERRLLIKLLQAVRPEVKLQFLG